MPTTTLSTITHSSIDLLKPLPKKLHPQTEGVYLTAQEATDLSAFLWLSADQLKRSIIQVFKEEAYNRMMCEYLFYEKGQYYCDIINSLPQGDRTAFRDRVLARSIVWGGDRMAKVLDSEKLDAIAGSLPDIMDSYLGFNTRPKSDHSLTVQRDLAGCELPNGYNLLFLHAMKKGTHEWISGALKHFGRQSKAQALRQFTAGAMSIHQNPTFLKWSYVSQTYSHMLDNQSALFREECSEVLRVKARMFYVLTCFHQMQRIAYYDACANHYEFDGWGKEVFSKKNTPHWARITMNRIAEKGVTCRDIEREDDMLDIEIDGSIFDVMALDGLMDHSSLMERMVYPYLDDIGSDREWNLISMMD